MASHIRSSGPEPVEKTLPSPRQSPSQQTPPAAMEPYHDAQSRITQSILQDCLNKITKHRSRYIDKDHMKKFNISSTDFDLRTGKDNNANGPEYTTPFDLSNLHTILRKAEPWYHYTLSKEKDPNDTCAAAQIAGMLENYLGRTKDDKLQMPRDKYLKSLLEYTTWNLRDINVDVLGENLMSSKPGAEYRVPFILDTFDFSAPHISCFLAQSAPLRSDCLATNEVMCILYLTASRLRRAEYRYHRIIPVTVFSGCSRKIRVVQAYVDNKTGKIEVRKSQIGDLEKEDLPKIELLLSWAVGKPTGITRYREH